MADDNSIKLPDLPEDIFENEGSVKPPEGSTPPPQPSATQDSSGQPSQYKATIPQPTPRVGNVPAAPQPAEQQETQAPLQAVPPPVTPVENTEAHSPELPTVSKEEEDDMFAGVLESNTPQNTKPLAPPPLPNKKPKSSMKLIINIIVVIILFAAVGALAYMFFTRESTPDIEEEIPPITNDPVVEEPVVEEPEVIDTTNWERYTNETIGATFEYPESWSVTENTLMSTGTEADTAKYIHIENEDGAEMLTVWMHARGVESFILPYSGLYNPYFASTQLLLTNESSELTVTSKTFQGLSDAVSPRLDTYIAYTPERVGTRKYIFLLTTQRANGEDLLALIAESTIVKSDSDGDGLFDTEEEALGTDPNNPDTDGDTFLDGVEVENGFNPLGEGRL